ncbi:MAG: hypothetical protein ACRDH5_01445 [bacterium]
MDFGPGIALPIIFLSFAAIFILRGPLGRALADRIAGRTATMDLVGANRVLAELDEVRRRLAEVEERLDFTERLLAKNREADRPQRVGPGT